MSTLQCDWTCTHCGGLLPSLLVLVAWSRVGFGLLWTFDIFWTGPKGLFLNAVFGASMGWWGWGRWGWGGTVLADRTGETPVTFATWAGWRGPFWIAPKNRQQMSDIYTVYKQTCYWRVSLVFSHPDPIFFMFLCQVTDGDNIFNGSSMWPLQLTAANQAAIAAC